MATSGKGAERTLVKMLPPLDELACRRLLVVGDLILDEYLWGDVSRISPEAPVPVFAGRDREFRAGGAGCVAENLAVLGVEVDLLGLVGRDEGGDQLRHLLESRGISTSGVLRSAGRPTTRKTRLMASVQQAHRAQQQVLRVDWEEVRALTRDEFADIDAWVSERFKTPVDAVLVSDYAKGLVTKELVRVLINRARAAGVPVLIDPGRSGDYGLYQGATLLCPNRFETQQATGMTLDCPEAHVEAGRWLVRKLGLEAVVLTLDREGMCVVTADGEGTHFPTEARAVTDVAGAGDMVLSILGIALGSGWSLDAACQLANVAAGIEISKVGVVPVELWEIEQGLVEGVGGMTSKLRSHGDLLKIVKRVRATGKSVVFTNGCFDFVHGGHVLLLERAASLGDVLIVALNSDASVARLKGKGRPIYPEEQRARILSGFSFVDHVVFFEDDTPLELIRELRPEVLVKGADYRDRAVVGRELVESAGGRVELVQLQPDVSTTMILDRIRQHRG